MPKFEKRNTRGFQAKNVPYNKGVKIDKGEIVPAPYTRLSSEMDRVVRDPPSASERQEMLLRPGCHHFLRPRKLESASTNECLNAQMLDR